MAKTFGVCLRRGFSFELHEVGHMVQLGTTMKKVEGCELLCGACETDYGHSSVDECTRCQATWIYTALISFTMLLSLFLVIDTLRGNLLTERCQDVFEAQGFSMHIPLAEISCLNGEPQAEKSQASSRETPSHRLLVVDIVRLWGISL
ncbi:hypothetical protein BSKO_08577 [Bryopsis sp. KO-2023]|nr:hypothetical protein BSKO_08577 [Bryopsis sp. KO-2023]